MAPWQQAWFFCSVFLPLLVFGAALKGDVRRIIEDAAPILVLAVIATFVAAGVVGIALWPFAGLPLAVAVFQRLSPDLQIQANVRDGAAVAAGVHVLTLSGPARAVLAGERTALNFVGRLSGVATLPGGRPGEIVSRRWRIEG